MDRYVSIFLLPPLRVGAALEGLEVVLPLCDVGDDVLPPCFEEFVLLVPAEGLLLEFVLLLGELFVGGFYEVILSLSFLLGLEEGVGVTDAGVPEVVELVFEAAVLVGRVDDLGLSGVDDVLLPLEHPQRHLPPVLLLVGLAEKELEGQSVLLLLQIQLPHLID